MPFRLDVGGNPQWNRESCLISRRGDVTVIIAARRGNNVVLIQRVSPTLPHVMMY